MKKLDPQQSEIWLVEPWPPLDQQENVTTPRHFMWQTATEPTEWIERSTRSYCEEHVFLEISLHKHEQQLAETLLHLPLPHWEDCTERRNKEDLVTSLWDRGVPDELITDVSSDATHWPTNKPNEPETRIEHMILRHSFWSRPLREQPLCKNLSVSTASTLNLPDNSTQKFKHTRTHHLHFTKNAWSVVIGKQRRQDLQQRNETKGNLRNTRPKRNPTHYAAITTRWWACTDEQENDSHTKEHLPLPIPTKKHAKHLRGKNPKWPCPVALRKKGVGWTGPWRVNWNERTRRKRRASETWAKHKTWSWTATSDEKHYQEEATITSGAHLKNNTMIALSNLLTRKNLLAQRSDTSCNTLRPNLQNDSTFLSSSLTKKHVFPEVS